MKSSSPELSGLLEDKVCGLGKSRWCFLCSVTGKGKEQVVTELIHMHRRLSLPPSSLPASEMKDAGRKAPGDIPALRILAHFESLSEIKSMTWSASPNPGVPVYHEANLNDAEISSSRGLVVHQSVCGGEACVLAGV